VIENTPAAWPEAGRGRLSVHRFFGAAVSLYYSLSGSGFARGRTILVKKSRKVAFDPKIFLAKVGDGKTISKYQKDEIVFSQGDVADAVFTSRRVRSS
jgi:hypothetical protein